MRSAHRIRKDISVCLAYAREAPGPSEDIEGERGRQGGERIDCGSNS